MTLKQQMNTLRSIVLNVSLTERIKSWKAINQFVSEHNQSLILDGRNNVNILHTRSIGTHICLNARAQRSRNNGTHPPSNDGSQSISLWITHKNGSQAAISPRIYHYRQPDNQRLPSVNEEEWSDASAAHHNERINNGSR